MSTAPEQGALSIETLVEDHSDYLFRYAFRHISDPDKAEDLVQETYLAAIGALPRFEGTSSPRTWLTGILRHKILDLIKKRKPEEGCDFSDEEDPLLHTLFDPSGHWRAETGPLLWGADPESELRKKEFYLHLDRCIAKLPERFRQVFMLRELDGMEREMIADHLALSSSNVGVLLHRARLQLQRCLQINWHGGGSKERTR